MNLNKRILLCSAFMIYELVPHNLCSVADRGGGGSEPPFGPQCRLYNISTKAGPARLCGDLISRTPPFQNSASALAAWFTFDISST